jgi:hypothetical protein
MIDDPVTPEEYGTINRAVRQALNEAERVRSIILDVRPSDESVAALDALDAAIAFLNGFLERED